MTALDAATPDQMRHALAAVLKEHEHERDIDGYDGWCAQCGDSWPCTTILAITDAGIEVPG